MGHTTGTRDLVATMTLMIRRLLRYRRHLVLMFHVAAIGLSLITAFLLRFDFGLPDEMKTLVLKGLLAAAVLKVPVFISARLHSASWRFAGVRELWHLLVANTLATAAFTVVALVWLGPSGFPRSIYILDFLLCLLLTASGQFVVRIHSEFRSATRSKRDSKGIVVYGAGAAGRMLVREIQTNPSLGYQVIAFVDDNRRLHGSTVMDVPVVGAGRDLAAVVDRYGVRSTKIEEIIVAMPSATARQTLEALANCRSAGVACKTIPRFGELLAGRVLSSQIRNINLVDLLGREPVRLEEHRIQGTIGGRSVLVTGAAGSIGSELCRQTARFEPARLILFDQAESPLYTIDLEMRAKFPSMEIVAELGDVRDPTVVDDLIRRHRVDSVFHAAAYKHVPLLEAHVAEAVRTNILGTWNVVRAAHRHHVSNFLMISTDKAVNPSSVMGLTKRIAELIAHATTADGNKSATRFSSVRFGNVLGSNGSVVPVFQAQIAAGGPVTVTHPEMRRYFMSIPEAVALVLQASTMCKDSEIFVLDMGEPVRIVDLAKNLIGLAGLVPNEDIEIRFTGLRPGEKLFEELKLEGEDISPTYHEKIRIFSGARLMSADLEPWLAIVGSLIDSGDTEALLNHLQMLVPEYDPMPPSRAPDEAVQRHSASGHRSAARKLPWLSERAQPSPAGTAAAEPLST